MKSITGGTAPSDGPFAPDLPDWAYHPMPDGVRINGRPNDYRTALLSATKIYRLETPAEREAARRILRFQITNRRWVAVSLRGLEAALQQAPLDVSLDEETQKDPHGDDLVRVGVEMLVDKGLLGSSSDGEDTIVWMTQTLLDLLTPHRPAPLPAA